MKSIFFSRSALKSYMASGAISVLLCMNQASAQTKLTVQSGAPVPALDFIGLYVAQHAGFFKEEGLEVDFRNTANASTAVQLAASGSADVAFATIEPLILGYDSGIRGKAFAQSTGRVIYAIAIPKSSRPAQLTDLKNAKIGVTNLGSAAVPVAASILSAANVATSRDTFVPVGAGDQALAALQSKKVQALALWDGMYSAMEKNGQPFEYFRNQSLIGFSNLALIASDATLADKQPELCKFARGIARGTIFAIANPEAALKMYWKVNQAARVQAGDESGLRKAIEELKFITNPMEQGMSIGGRYGFINQAGLKLYKDIVSSGKESLSKVHETTFFTNALSACINQFDKQAVQKLAQDSKF